jgi:hypothetical protein
MFAPYLVLVAWIDRIFGKFRGAGGDDAKPRGDGLWYVLSRIGTLKLLANRFLGWSSRNFRASNPL